MSNYNCLTMMILRKCRANYEELTSLINRADSIGINTRKAVDAILTSGRVEQQAYRSCMGLLKLAEKHSPSKLEEACKRALLYSRTPSYKSIKNLLAAMKENPESASQDSDQLSSGSQAHGITRGARYYGGKKS